MDDYRGIPVPADQRSETQVFGLKNTVAKSLEVTPQDVHLWNAEEFLAKKPRFLYGFTEPADKPPGFIKASQDAENNTQLKRESLGLEIARKVGIPTVETLHPFQTTSEGLGIIHTERLDAEHGVVLTSPELIAAADPQLGTAAARALAASSGRKIPRNIDSELLKRGDWRNHSLETFSKVWDEQGEIVFNPVNAQLVDGLIGVEKLHAIADETKTSMGSLIKAADNPSDEYFIHNDTAPNNVFFKDAGEVVFLDFEHAAASHNLFLAQLTDLGNYFGRMWPNPEMQVQFLTSFLAASSHDAIEYNYQLLRATAVFGSMYLAKYGMAPDHVEHAMAKSLLGNLENNLAKLDEKYAEMKTANFTLLVSETTV